MVCICPLDNFTNIILPHKHVKSEPRGIFSKSDFLIFTNANMILNEAIFWEWNDKHNSKKDETL